MKKIILVFFLTSVMRPGLKAQDFPTGVFQISEIYYHVHSLERTLDVFRETHTMAPFSFPPQSYLFFSFFEDSISTVLTISVAHDSILLMAIGEHRPLTDNDRMAYYGEEYVNSQRGMPDEIALVLDGDIVSHMFLKGKQKAFIILEPLSESKSVPGRFYYRFVIFIDNKATFDIVTYI